MKAAKTALPATQIRMWSLWLRSLHLTTACWFSSWLCLFLYLCLFCFPLSAPCLSCLFLSTGHHGEVQMRSLSAPEVTRPPHLMLTCNLQAILSAYYQGTKIICPGLDEISVQPQPDEEVTWCLSISDFHSC